ncbi:hypothetical protein ACIGBL_08860 [Streptomyces sp. NPDC085614]|uniref:hypothetical protein n=1 Tax=Streptomyces sp. NPDC085614 TaxID=3365733 RepID=UPI0037D0E98B
MSDEDWAALVEAAQRDGVGGTAPPKPRRWRIRKGRPGGMPAGQPKGWRTGPAWQEMNGRAARRRRIKAVLGMALVVLLALVAVRPQLLTDRLPDELTAALPDGLGGDRDSAPLAAETARPTAAPSREAFPDTPTLKDPFKGSPALRWADGAAGIELPRAKATNGLSEARIAAALKKAKAFLVAANIDPATVRGDRPAAALALMDPRGKELRDAMTRAVERPTEKDDPLALFSRFDPQRVRPVGDVVKTRGRMTVRKGKRPGEVEIVADYTFVYPLVKTRPGFDEVARTIVRRQVTFGVYDPARYRVTEGRVMVVGYDMSFGNDSCEEKEDGFLHPEFTEDLAAAPRGSGPAVDPYDRSEEMRPDRARGGCGTVTRT